MLKKIMFFVMALALPYAAHAGDTTGITFKQMWARATIGTATTGVVYGVVENRSGQDDAIVGVQTPVARMAHIHRTTMDSRGIMTMEPMEEIVLKNNTFVAMEPGDIHIMLMNLNQKLEAGYEIPLTFEFENAPAQHVRVKIYPTDTKWADIKEGN